MTHAGREILRSAEKNGAESFMISVADHAEAKGTITIARTAYRGKVSPSLGANVRLDLSRLTALFRCGNRQPPDCDKSPVECGVMDRDCETLRAMGRAILQGQRRRDPSLAGRPHQVMGPRRCYPTGGL